VGKQILYQAIAIALHRRPTPESIGVESIKASGCHGADEIAFVKSIYGL
jgi:hypothetical protein